MNDARVGHPCHGNDEGRAASGRPCEGAEATTANAL
jgi:hypothetical protein